MKVVAIDQIWSSCLQEKSELPFPFSDSIVFEHSMGENALQKTVE